MKVLVIAAHPDDEILGCGATMARHSAAGDEVNVIIVAEGITSRVNSEADTAALNQLHEAAKMANDVVGVNSLKLLGNPDNKLDSLPLLTIVQQIEKQIQLIKPDVVYTHFAGDLNIDHRVVYQAVMTACRPVSSHVVKSIYCFEVPSSTEWAPSEPFVPNHFVNIAETLDKKIEALLRYETEMRPWPHPRSLKAVEHLAKWRGAIIGAEAAEAFILARGIQ